MTNVLSKVVRRTAWTATAMLLGTAAAIGPAGPAYAATWSIVPTPNPHSFSNNLNAIDAQSGTSAWAVGGGSINNGSTIRPILARWNGTAWSAAAHPMANSAAVLSGIDGDSASNVWAVGSSETGTLTERWNGSAWSVVSSPLPAGALGGGLRAVKSLSANDAWAVGSYAASSSPVGRSLITHWTGASWTVVPSPNPDPTFQNPLNAVDASGPNDVWAVGNFGHDGYGGDTVEGMVLRWNGTTWTNLALPAFDGVLRRTKLHDLVVLSSSDVWVVGTGFSWQTFAQVPYLLHWNGQSWQQSTIPNPPSGAEFRGVTALSPTKVYAVGVKNYTQTFVARWNGTTWSQESTPSSVAGSNTLVDAASTGTGTVWAAGYTYDSGAGTMSTLALRTTNG